MYVLRSAAVCLLVALPAAPQPPAFASAAIQPARPGGPRNPRIRVLPRGDLRATAVPVIALLSFAYDVPVNPSSRLSALPEWALRDRYDIEAQAPPNAVPAGARDGELRRRAREMIRGLLADRFKLVMRVENRTMSIYALTVVAGGARLRKSTLSGKDCALDTAPDTCHDFAGGLGHPLNAEAVDMDDLARYISNWTDLPVVNRTALDGLFTLHSEGWTPMRLPPPPPGAPPGANPFAGLPSIFTVLAKLGLELKRAQAVLPVYTVEHIAPPG